jgi:hypothetical protein
MTDKPTSAKRTSTTDKTAKVFSEGERAAIQDRAKELKSETRRGPEAKRAADLADVLAKIAEMPAADRDLAQLVHQIITTNVPELSPKTWYGMLSYALTSPCRSDSGYPLSSQALAQLTADVVIGGCTIKSRRASDEETYRWQLTRVARLSASTYWSASGRPTSQA